MTADNRAALIAGLRELADFYEQHPEVPTPAWPEWKHCVASTTEDGRAIVEAYAEALGTQVSERPDGQGGVHSIEVRHQFGPVEVEVYQCTPTVMRRHDTEMAFIRAARWVFTCTDEPDAVSYRYATETACRDSLDVHAEGCPGSHQVKLVSGEPVGSAS